MGENLFKGTSPQIESKGMNKKKQKNQVFVEVPNRTTTAVKSTRSYHSDITHSIAFKNKKKTEGIYKYLNIYTHVYTHFSIPTSSEMWIKVSKWYFSF